MLVFLRRALFIAATSFLISATLVSAAEAAIQPAAPTGLKASTTSSVATLSWSPAKDAKTYAVCLKTSATATNCLRTSSPSTATTTTFSGLRPTSGTDYYFRVSAINGTERTRSALKGFNLAPQPAPPEVPTGITQKVTYSSLTVTWTVAARAEGYSVCLMTREATETCAKTSARSTNTTATFAGLVPTGGADYFYRVYAYDGAASSRSVKHRADLPVGPIGSATATKGDTGVIAASWEAARNAGTYDFQLATDSAMTTGLRTYTVSQTRVNPSGLPIGKTYYYRVRGANGIVKGVYTAVGTIRLPSQPTRISVLTYNLCGQDKCVTRSNGMKTWSTRKAYAGRIARATGADIIATQESHDLDTRFGTELPGFGLAAYYSAKSLFYNKDRYELLRSGRITLSSTYRKYAVWAEFRGKVTRTKFIVADAHLQPYKGKTNDDLRAAQTKVLISRIASINTAKIPVVYAGDYNSNKSNADQTRYPGGYDAPLRVFARAGIPDTVDRAATPVYRAWNSANQAINPPLKHSDHVDHIFADQVIAVSSWRVVITLNGLNYATPFATDHNPVRAILTIPGR